MPFEDKDQDYMFYTWPAQLYRRVARFTNQLTAHNRRVKAKVIVDREIPPERQHINTKKWPYYVEISFNRQLSSTSWRRLGALNSLLLLTEEDNLLFGVYFVRLHLDRPERYDYRELVLAICEVFDWTLESCTIERREVN